MENKNWPDKARLKMIEKSDRFPNSVEIYQYGFYDGYQYRNEQCQKRDELIKAQDALINFKEDHFGQGWTIALKLIEKIEQLKKELQ